jgi:hypothetical protein
MLDTCFMLPCIRRITVLDDRRGNVQMAMFLLKILFFLVWSAVFTSSEGLKIISICCLLFMYLSVYFLFIAISRTYIISLYRPLRLVVVRRPITEEQHFIICFSKQVTDIVLEKGPIKIISNESQSKKIYSCINQNDKAT